MGSRSGSRPEFGEFGCNPGLWWLGSGEQLERALPEAVEPRTGRSEVGSAPSLRLATRRDHGVVTFCLAATIAQRPTRVALEPLGTSAPGARAHSSRAKCRRRRTFEHAHTGVGVRKGHGEIATCGAPRAASRMTAPRATLPSVSPGVNSRRLDVATSPSCTHTTSTARRKSR